MWWAVVGGAVAGLLLVWVVCVYALWRSAPETTSVQDAMRVLPDLLRLVRRLAGDASLPRGVRVRLWLALAYLASPIDLIPDFMPVLGYADDALVVAVVLRSVVRRAGPDAVSGHWTGTPAGLVAVSRLAGLPLLQ
jgi:uncharacterized membrane protein YkvA (DUF1232 family)